MNLTEYRQIIVNSYSGFTCGILPNLDCCVGCEFLFAKMPNLSVVGDAPFECEKAQDFADALLKILPLPSLL